MSAERAVKEEPIPGYRLLEPLGRGGFGEVWKCEAPGGLLKAIKFVKGGDHGQGAGSNAAQELRSLQHIKSIRHPFLLSIERVEIVGSDLVIVMELADRSLHDVLDEHRRNGRVGLPRKELIGYLREAAEVLDLMNQEHGLQHLDIKPRNLFLVGRHVKVADFGLVNSLAELHGTDGGLLGGITPLYAAPETFDGRATLSSDQYSLAVTYHELLTGKVPIRAQSVRQLALLVATAAPDLAGLAEAERAIVNRALAKEPRERFESCMAFVEALEAVSPPASGTVPAVPAPTTSVDIPLGNLAATAVVGNQGTESSVLYRRPSRVVAALRQGTVPGADGPLPGYQLHESLGRGPTGEVWRASGPSGEPRLVRFLSTANLVAPDADTPSGSTPGTSPLDRLLTLSHQNLPGLEVVPIGADRVALISEAGEFSLQAKLKEYQTTGQPGIPRLELLGYLGQTAAALDHLYHLYQLQHLGLTARHLAMAGGQVMLLDFGLVELLWMPMGVQPHTINPRYSAVELFKGLISDACDQYSLALLFQELLVGLHPLRNLNARQMASLRMRGQPDVSLLPGLDRPIVLRALHQEPEKRFRSCREFILALQEATYQVESCAVMVPATPRPVTVSPGGAQGGGSGVVPAVPQPPAWRSAIDELVHAAGRGQDIRSAGLVHYRMAPGSHIEHRCWARLVAGMARLKMDGFREQWQADAITWKESRFVMEVQTGGSLLQRCLGRVPGLVVDVCLGNQRETANNLTPIRITIQPSACGRGRADQLLAEMGSQLLGSLQAYFHSQAERAAQERFPLSQMVYVQAPGGRQTTAQMRDIGRDGLCLYSPNQLTSGPVTLTLTRWASPLTVQVSGWVRDCIPADDGRFEVEVTFGG